MKFLDKSFNALLVGGACSILVACGGGSDAPSSPVVSTGVFIDGPVSGIKYDTATQSGDTNDKGEFKYTVGESVTFSIGSIVFPATPAKSIVTPLDIANTANPANQVATNILILLQSLDADGIPTNGIQILNAAKTNATSSLDFNVTPEAFSANSVVLGLIENSGSVNKTPVSKEAAIAHFESSMSEITEPNVPPTEVPANPAYTLYKPDLSVTSVNVTSTTSGADAVTSIPLTAALTATYTTSDNGANYTWGGAAVGGNVKANGNVALACTGNTRQSGYVAVASQATLVTDVTSIYGKIFDEFACGDNSTSSGTLAIDANGAITISGEGLAYTNTETSQIFSVNGLTTDGETIRGAIYSFTDGSVTKYFYVIRADEFDGDSVFIGVQQ